MDGRRVGGWLTVLGLLAVATSAHAGPVITWSYSSTLDPIGGADWYPGVMTTLQNIHGQYVSALIGTSGEPKSGWQTITVGTIHPTDGGGDPLARIASSYRLTLNLTDTASGESGKVTYTGGAQETATWEGDPPFQVPVDRQAYVYGLAPEGNETLTLGGHEYKVTLTSRTGDGGDAIIEANVRVGAASETPEPGTLILAGVAVAGGIGAWVRRKRLTPQT